MPKPITYLLIFSIIFSSFSPILATRVSAEINPYYKMNLTVPDATVEEPSPTEVDKSTLSDSAAVVACSTGLGGFLTEIIGNIGNALKCQMAKLAGKQCTVSTGGVDTLQKCKEWVKNKMTSIKKYKAQLLKLLIATTVRRLVDNMAMDVVDWIGGKTTGEPQFVTNFGKYILDSVNESVGDTIEMAGMSNLLCSPFKAEVVMKLGFPGARAPLPYCTLNRVISNIENFYEDFTNGGWIAFNEITQPQNNPLGAWIMQVEYMQEQAASVAYEQEQQIKSGFAPTKACRALLTDPETGEETCLEYEISITGQTKSDITSKSLATQMDNADKYMITENDLLNYGQLILNAIISRVVTSAKQNIFGGKTYGEGLLNFPEQAEEDPNQKYSCLKAADIAACIPDDKGEFSTKEDCQTSCTIKYRCDSELFICIGDDINGIYESEGDCAEKCRAGGGECNTEPELCSNINVYVRGQKCDGPLSNCAVVGPNNINPTCCDIFCSHMRDVMYPQATALHSWDWDDSKDNGIIGTVCKYAGVPVQSECHCSISNMGGACFTGIPKSKCGNPLAGKYPEYDKGLLICKGEPPYCVSDTKEEPTCTDCTNMYVRGRLGGAKTDACEGGVCPFCSGTRYVNSRNKVCEAFCLHTKEFLWGKEGLPSEKQFTKQEIINKGFESLFTHLSESIPNEGCYCQRPLTNSTFADGYVCYDCIPVQGKNLEGNESMDWEFSVCKGSAWCDANCSD